MRDASRTRQGRRASQEINTSLSPRWPRRTQRRETHRVTPGRSAIAVSLFWSLIHQPCSSPTINGTMYTSMPVHCPTSSAYAEAGSHYPTMPSRPRLREGAGPVVAGAQQDPPRLAPRAEGTRGRSNQTKTNQKRRRPQTPGRPPPANTPCTTNGWQKRGRESINSRGASMRPGVIWGAKP